MKKVSSEERLSMVLHGNFGSKLPTDDYGLFILNAAIIMSSRIISFSEHLTGIDFSEYELKVGIPESNAKYYANEAEEAVVDYICDVKGFKGLKKKKYFIEWSKKMQALYKENSIAWTEEIKSQASDLIKTFMIMEKIPAKNHGHMIESV